MDLTIRIQEKNGEFVASCLELDVHCFGPSKEKASARLKSVIQFYFDSAQDINLHNLENTEDKSFQEKQIPLSNRENQLSVH